MTIVAIPPLVPLPPFPSPNLPEDQYDDAAFNWGNAIPGHSTSVSAIAEAGRTNALDTKDSATAAASSATAATQQADLARDYRNQAGNSATAAAGSATQAAGSATSAQASYNSMQALYLGPKAAPPSADNSGNPLQVGTWYVNTSQGSWFWWNGASWVLGISDVAGSFVPLAGGATMTGPLSVPAGASGSQVPRAGDVRLKSDGIPLGDLVSTTGLAITLSTKTNTGDVTGAGGGTLQVMGDATSGAFMSFHRSGAYAINMGLDTGNVFRVGGWSQGTGATRFAVGTDGRITATGDLTAFSDMRLKRDIEPVPGALVLVNKLRGVFFKRKGDPDGRRHLGVIAQEVEQVLPEVVHSNLDAEGRNPTLSVSYGNMVGVLIEAVKELTARVEELEAQR